MRGRVQGVGIVVVLLLIGGCAMTSGPPTPAADETSASATVGSVTIANAFVTSPGGARYAPGGSAVAEFTLSSTGSSWDALTSVDSSSADSVRLFLVGSPQSQLTVTTGATGKTDASAQLIGLHEQLSPGARVPLTFHFTAAGSVTVDVPVH